MAGDGYEVNGGRVLRYSDAFRRQVVSEIEEGLLPSVSAAQRRYGIKGADTVRRWVVRFGKNALLRKVVRVETTEERDELKKAKERIRQLEKVVADERLDQALLRAHLSIACRHLGVDPEEFKKKHPVKP